MDAVIGVTPDDGGDDALALGCALARTLGADPLLVHVHPAGYDYPSPGNVDAEWEAYVRAEARGVVDRAAARSGWEGVRTRVHAHRSSGTGLAQVAEEVGAGLVVVGSAPGGSQGRLELGSTADQLLHGCPVPVALAPRGYAAWAPARVGRLVVAFGGTRTSERALAGAVALPGTQALPLVLLAVELRHSRWSPARLAGGLAGDGDADGEAARLERLRAAADDAAARLAPGRDVTTLAVAADRVPAALGRVDWREDDLLVIGSASAGPLRRVFLGDMTFRLLRAAPAAALVLPRGE